MYSVGVLLWEVLARERFLADLVGFDAVQWLIRNRFRLPEPKSGPLPKKYMRIIKRATAYASQERYKSATEMIKAFESPDGFLPDEGKIAVVGQHGSPTMIGPWMWVILVGVALISLGIFTDISGLLESLANLIGVSEPPPKVIEERLPSF